MLCDNCILLHLIDSLTIPLNSNYLENIYFVKISTVYPSGLFSIIHSLHCETDKCARGIGAQTTRNQITMKGRNCHCCELWFKEAEKKSRSSNTLMGQKTFYWKVVLKQVFKNDQKSSDRLDSGSSWNFLCCGNFPDVSRIHPADTDTQDSRT